MQESGPSQHAFTPSEGTQSLAPISVTRSVRPRPSSRAVAAQPKSIGFLGISFVIVSFGIAIGASTVGMHELLDQRSARAAAAAAAHSPAPAPAATSLPDAAGTAAADADAVADAGAAPGTAAATAADAAGSGMAKGRFHPRRVGAPHRPGEGSAKHPSPVPPPNPYNNALE